MSHTDNIFKFVNLSEDLSGEGGIRTHGSTSGTTVFETARFNHSRTSPVNLKPGEINSKITILFSVVKGQTAKVLL
jgi:hypothetical protein